MKKHIFLSALICVGCYIGQSQVLLYSNDFSSPPGSEWNFVGTSSNTYSRQYLGPISSAMGNPQSIVLDLGTQPPGNYQLDYNLLWFFTMDSELFELRQGVGGPVLYTRTMANGGGSLQGGEVRSEIITHTGGNLVLEFYSTTDQPFPDEWWGLDDVSISPLSGVAVPTLSQWSLIILGVSFLSIGGIVLFRMSV